MEVRMNELQGTSCLGLRQRKGLACILPDKQGSQMGSGASFELMTRQRRAAATSCAQSLYNDDGKAFYATTKRP